ncbi:hypothetical protein [Legionella micdadei]|uniref:DUF4189 domain-containing protein n=1 Tax=Legionella micdadei TaxID=451 RepID=A0A098GFX9_LEGMI|nr:hypothetical protein [Legionella micdadei]ARG97545.1 hypothetical protein B6N58_07635 [Legionella micdadei]ARH00142.1 hypothetical protein B6V88_06790 [Legionella micdadei]KTD27622.1 hypothetical protein Lmic_1942 [Legionella micdadei]NSL17605.1 hypothetical protein [Legionella micdadei]CEG60892.1 conserved exported protein of unknown function [Legionella micdadei]
MNKTLMTMLIIINSVLSTTVSAETLEGSFWRCTAFDGEDKEWTVDSSYEISAVNKAFEECKKQSKVPSSCKTAKEACEAFVNGKSTRPMWRCTALDQMAKTWLSNVYTHRDDAAIAAKAYCEQNSAFPDTCYINLMTCKNLNSRE